MPNAKLTYAQHVQFLKDSKKMSYLELMNKYNFKSKTSIQNWKYKKPSKSRWMGDTDLNFNTFNKIDTEEKAYWLGFIAGDGDVNDNKDFRIKIALNKKDILHIDKFISFINTQNVTYYDKKQKTIQIAIYSKKMVEDLKQYGITPKKSFTLQFPSNLSNKLISHFIRGLFDADGCITYDGRDMRPVFSFVGTYNTCKQLNKYLKIKNKIGWDRSVRQISTSGFDNCARIYNYLYKDATVYLDRKKKKFEELLCIH
jgi:hypothetical protein